jgi:hypothetical protein
MQRCPICYSGLEARPVAPCYDCGHSERELVELAAREHTYHEFRAFGQHSLTLCDFCDADFGSYYPSYFGLPDRGRVIGEVLQLVRAIDPSPFPIIDGYCEECQHRLAFLEFLAAVRQQHSANGGIKLT